MFWFTWFSGSLVADIDDNMSSDLWQLSSYESRKG